MDISEGSLPLDDISDSFTPTQPDKELVNVAFSIMSVFLTQIFPTVLFSALLYHSSKIDLFMTPHLSLC